MNAPTNLLKLLTPLLLPLLLLGLTACAHEMKQNCELKEKAQGEITPHSPSDIKKSAQEIFASAPGLTEVQRQKLSEVLRKIASDGAEIRKQIGEAKTDLFKAVSSKAFASKEVTEIRDKITALDQKRLVLMNKALADVQAIVGFGPDKEEFYRRLRELDAPPGGRISRAE